MPEYLAPDVYVEETSFRSKSIEGVSTSTTAFVGMTRRGPTDDSPELLTSFSDFERIYGGLNDLATSGKDNINYIAHAAAAYFNEGGARLYVFRVAAGDVARSAKIATSSQFIARFAGDSGNGTVEVSVKRTPFSIASKDNALEGSFVEAEATDKTKSYAVKAGSIWRNAERLGDPYNFDSAATLSLVTLRVTFTDKDGFSETFDDLGLHKTHKRFIGDILHKDGNGRTDDVSRMLSFRKQNAKESPDTTVDDPAHQLFMAFNFNPSRVFMLGGPKIAQSDLIGDHYELVLDQARIDKEVKSLSLPQDAKDIKVSLVVTSKLQGLSPEQAKGEKQGSLIKVTTGNETKYALGVMEEGDLVWKNATNPDESITIVGNTTSKISISVTLEVDYKTSAPSTSTQRQVPLEDFALHPEGESFIGNPDGLGEFSKPLLRSRTADDALPDAYALYQTLLNSNGQPKTHPLKCYVSPGTDKEPILKDWEDKIDAMAALDDVSIVAAPGSTETTVSDGVSLKLRSHAEARRSYRIAVLDVPKKKSPAEAKSAKASIDSKYAALYYPWVVAPNPLFNPYNPSEHAELVLPPSGFVCGIYARSDIERGVFKAPANEVVRGALRLERQISTGEQEQLNPLGVNCLRYFAGRGHRVWGARTTSSDPEWKYVNIRRYFLYLEHSIDRGTQWAVFEPNGERLWSNVRDTVKSFLYNEWLNGALLGETPEQAYFVKCDRTVMSQNDLDNGRLICLVGVAAIKPAEFVIFRIGQKTVESRG